MRTYFTRYRQAVRRRRVFHRWTARGPGRGTLWWVDEGGAAAEWAEWAEWAALAQAQDGVVARAQLLALGLSARQARRWLDAGRWQQIHPGIYLTHTGPVGDLARVWAAVLQAGEGAAAGGLTALWLFGAMTELAEPIEICVPHDRQVRAMAGVRIRRRRHLAECIHPVTAPPRVRVEHAVLDVTDRQRSAEAALDVVLRTIQRRVTTPERLAKQLLGRPRHRWRSLLNDVLGEAADGVASVLELRYARDVERAHALPAGRRNQVEQLSGRRRYRDVRYLEFATVVELDGREAHPTDTAFRDMNRDNAVVAAGDSVLRYGWRDVAARPCQAAAQVAVVLRRNGWSGRLRRCGPTCGLASSDIG